MIPRKYRKQKKQNPEDQNSPSIGPKRTERKEDILKTISTITTAFLFMQRVQNPSIQLHILKQEIWSNSQELIKEWETQNDCMSWDWENRTSHLPCRVKSWRFLLYLKVFRILLTQNTRPPIRPRSSKPRKKMPTFVYI